MNFVMTLMTQRQTVSDVVTQVRGCSPVANVMSGQSTSTNAAGLAGKLVSYKNCPSPLLVFITGTFTASTPAMFVLRILWPALIPGKITPFRRLRATVDAFNEPIPRDRICPLSQEVLAACFSSLGGRIDAFLRAIYLVGARRITELPSAVQTSAKDDGIVTQPRAVSSLASYRHTWRDVEGASASLADALNAFRCVPCAAFITAFERAALAATMFKSGLLNSKWLAAIVAYLRDDCHCPSAKGDPRRQAACCCLGNTHEPLGVMKQENRLWIMLPRRLQYSAG